MIVVLTIGRGRVTWRCDPNDGVCRCVEANGRCTEDTDCCGRRVCQSDNRGNRFCKGGRGQAEPEGPQELDFHVEIAKGAGQVGRPFVVPSARRLKSHSRGTVACAA
jgi:hypothetical protein